MSVSLNTALLAAWPLAACDEAGLPALWAFGYLLSITSYYTIS